MSFSLREAFRLQRKAEKYCRKDDADCEKRIAAIMEGIYTEFPQNHKMINKAFTNFM